MVQLQQTPFISVFPESGVRETLRLMARAPDEHLTSPIAQEIAVRRRIPAWVAGSIVPLGDRYVVTLTATSSTSTRVLARERVEAQRKSEVLSALGRASVELRRKPGAFLIFEVDESDSAVRVTITAPQRAGESADVLFEPFLPSLNDSHPTSAGPCSTPGTGCCT